MPPTPVGPEKWAQCTVVLHNRSGGRALRPPILCLDDMARSCAALAQGDPAMIFGIDLWSYRRAKHVGIEIKSGRETIAAAAAQGARKKRPRSPTLARIRLGQAVTFRPDNAKGGGLTLRFAAVPEDTRCPVNLDCFWAGAATVELAAWQGRTYLGTHAFEFSGGTSQIQRLGSQNLRIVDLDPDWRNGQTIGPRKYSIILEVRAGRAGPE